MFFRLYLPVRASNKSLVTQFQPSRPMSACLFFKLRLKLVLTLGIPPAFRNGVHSYRFKRHQVSPEFNRSRMLCGPMASANPQDSLSDGRGAFSRIPQGSIFVRLFFPTPTIVGKVKMCVCVFIKLHITTQSGPVILVILCHSH